MPHEPDAVVYIVDDDSAILKSLALLMKAEGYQALTCPSAQAFLNAYDPERPGCVLLDVRMPGVSGLELQEQLNASGTSIPVIVMTGHGDIPMAVRAMRAGARDFIEKPFSNERLLAQVRDALAASCNATEERARHAELRTRLEQLSPREREVLDLLVAGRLNKQVAADLNISVRTVEAHRARLMEKLEARSFSDLVRLALAVGDEL